MIILKYKFDNQLFCFWIFLAAKYKTTSQKIETIQILKKISSSTTKCKKSDKTIVNKIIFNKDKQW